MDAITKAKIGARLRHKREQAGYSREKLGELCSLSPRFIANVELGDSTFSLDSLMVVCKVLSCSSDYLLFGDSVDDGVWTETVAKIINMDVQYQTAVDKVLRGVIEAVMTAEKRE